MISRERRRRGRGRPGRDRRTTARSGYGEAAPIERYDEYAASALAYLEAHADELGDDPSRSRRSSTRLPAASSSRRAPRSTPRSTTCCGKLAGLPGVPAARPAREGPPTSWTIWLGDPDDMARRAERACDGRFRRLKLKLGGRDGLDVERVRAVRARHRPSAPGRRQRVLVARRGARGAAAARRARRRVLRAAAPRRRPGRAGAEARARRSRSTSTRTATRSPTSPRAPSARTGSTSSSRSRAASARRVRMAHAARALGLGVMLGCMIESGLGIAAGVPDREPLRPRRPRRQPPARPTTRGPASSSSTASSSLRRNPASASHRVKRYLVLAEGRSGRPALRQDGARRAPLRARRRRRDPRLAARGRDVWTGVPIVGSVDEALRLRADDGARRRRHAGGRFPPAWRELLKSCVAPGSTSRTASTSVVADDPELVELLGASGASSSRDLRRRPGRSQRPDRREPRRAGATIVLTVGSDCAIGKMTVSLELDLEARRRGIASRLRPDRADRHRDRGLGDRRRRRRRRLHRRRRRAARRRGRASAGASCCWVEGQGSLAPSAYSGVTLGLFHGSAPHVLVLCHEAGTESSTASRGTRSRRSRRSSSCTSGSALLARPAPVAAIALNTRGMEEDAARAAVAAAEAETGLPADDPVRFGAARLVDAVLARLDELPQ